MRNPHAYTVTALHDHRSGLAQQNKKGQFSTDWGTATAGSAQRDSAGQRRLKSSLSNMCDGSPPRVSSNTLAPESKQDGVIDDAAGLSGARGLRDKSSKLPYRGGLGRNVREHTSRERCNGEQQQGHSLRTQAIQSQTIQASVPHNSSPPMCQAEQNYVATPSPQFCDLLEFLEKVRFNRLHVSVAGRTRQALELHFCQCSLIYDTILSYVSE
jgi:hypothetical protein